MTTQAATYVLTSHAFLSRAEESLSEGNLTAASRNGWLAAAFMVRGTARSKGWRYLGSRGLDEVLDRLVDAYGDEDLWSEFSSGEALEINSYDNCMSSTTMEVHLSQVRQFLGKLESLPA
jgi:HEPN domain-containing protein